MVYGLYTKTPTTMKAVFISPAMEVAETPNLQDHEIHIFTQFFIHRKDNRNEEIRYCLKQNQENQEEEDDQLELFLIQKKRSMHQKSGRVRAIKDQARRGQHASRRGVGGGKQKRARKSDAPPRRHR